MKTSIISGGNGGLGRALATALEAQGWHCVLMDVNNDGLKASDSRTPVTVDLTDTAALTRAASDIIAARPSIDMVIYNAGASQIAPFAETDAQSHRRVFDINYFAAVEMARLFLHPLRASRGTHLAISSVAGFAPLYGRTAYAASKHAMQGFFASLRPEEAPHGERCLIAVPSFVATNIGNVERTADGTLRPGAAADSIDYMTPQDAARRRIADPAWCGERAGVLPRGPRCPACLVDDAGRAGVLSAGDAAQHPRTIRRVLSRMAQRHICLPRRGR